MKTSKDQNRSRTAQSTGSESTAILPGDWNAASQSRRSQDLLTLTILAHPEIERIGERVVLGELAGRRSASLSRSELLFAPPTGGRFRPLDGKFLSRKPISLATTGSGAVLFERGKSRTPLVIDGVPLIDRIEVPAARVNSGTAVVLGHRIALWLHRVELTDDPDDLPSYGLVGESDAVRSLRRALSRVADVDVSVLIRGPTGSGKELMARALHAHGPRPDGPFVAVNLGALSPALAAAELFGARKGAFTGAVRDQPGFFLRADGGTLFLDEVGEAPPELQVMLLRTLETGEVMPVGGQSPRRPKVRLISATDARLEARIEEGAFRAPLLHRLAGYCLDVPPLAARRDDLGRLLIHFLRQERDRLGEPAFPSGTAARPWLDPVLVARLAHYDWPGNVRELRNVVRELAIDSRSCESLVVSARLDERLPPWGARLSIAPSASKHKSPSPSRRRKPSEISEDELLEALRANRFELKAAAKKLEVSRTGLYARVARSPNVRAAADVPEQEIHRAHAEHDGALEGMVLELEVSERALRQRLKDLGLR